MSGSAPKLDSIQGAVLLCKHRQDLVSAAGGPAGGAVTNTLETRFQIASVSKQFTCAAILVLAERGALEVDDRISRWFGDIPDHWKGITVHQLMTHSSGLLHWPDLPQEIHTVPPSREVLLDMFMGRPLVAVPGAYSYSSPAYVLLAIIVEKCADKRYQQVLHDEVFALVGMHSTFAGDGNGHDDLALGYRGTDLVTSMSLEQTDIGAGDVWSTVGDLATWDRAILDGTFLSDTSRRRMLHPHVPMPDDVEGVRFEGYGYGWCVGTIAGHPMYFHTGGNFGYRSVNAILPDDDAIVVALLNDESADLEALALTLVSMALEAD